jgi:phage terminase large subunit-like protein
VRVSPTLGALHRDGVRPRSIARPAKEHKHSKRRIDLAVAAVMAHDRARHHAQQPRAAIYVLL